MAEETTTQQRPDAAMAAFIGELSKTGMADAASNALAQPKGDNAQATTVDGPVVTTGGERPVATTTEPKPVVETKPVSEVEPEPQDEKWPRKASDWDNYKKKRKEVEGQLKAERDAIKAERDRYKADIDQLTKAGPSTELESLKKERDQFEQLVRVAAVESHPQFKKYFEGKTNDQLELVKDIVGNDKAESITSLLKQPDSGWKRARVEEAIAELSPLQQAQLAGVMNNLTGIQREKQAAVAQAGETYQKMTKDQQDIASKNAAQAKAVIDSAFKSALAKIQDPQTGLSVYQPKEGDEAWNKEIETRIAIAQKLLSGDATPEQGMEALLQGVGFPALLKSYHTATEEISKLQQQVKELQGAEPSMATRTTTAPGSGNGEQVSQPVTIKVGTNPHDVVSDWTRKITQDFRP